ncbi:hypothetical protein ABID22_003061 [Pontibacter aydingkolensis]|uniref:Uncharacterized protein n=1 Tax=Pontibacter aydingkolensis TaxID=1911536 RepID=A0ABS7CXZ3_9BACT|nr:hypothetical protein [Pontibacter aydingkolensis]MBW7468682.1 hypothetical protein [Pontibacter aydingkolensis]
MKSVIAAVAMLLLLTLTFTGIKNTSRCNLEKRAKATNLEWRDNAASHTFEVTPVC